MSRTTVAQLEKEFDALYRKMEALSSVVTQQQAEIDALQARCDMQDELLQEHSDTFSKLRAWAKTFKVARPRSQAGNKVAARKARFLELLKQHPNLVLRRDGFYDGRGTKENPAKLVEKF